MDIYTITLILVIIFLLIISAFFSGSETALTAASRPKMHQLEKENNVRAKIVNFLKNMCFFKNIFENMRKTSSKFNLI